MNPNPRIRRAWVNAPSTLEGGHEFHGQRVLADFDGYKDNISGQETAWIWFTDGEREFARVPVASLSNGWPKVKA